MTKPLSQDSDSLHKRSCALVLGGYVNGYAIIRELHHCSVENIWLFDYGSSLARKSSLIKGYSTIAKCKDSLLQKLLELNLRYDKIVCFPTDDFQLELLSDISKEINSFCVLYFDKENIRNQLSKSFQYSICNKLNLPYPKSKLINQESSVNCLHELRLPLIVKPVRRDDQKIDVFRSLIIKEQADIDRCWSIVLEFSMRGIEFLASEYVPGDDDCIYAYTAYVNRNGDIISGWAGQKLTQYPDSQGVFSSARMIDNSELKEISTKLIDGIGATGIVEPEFKYDVRDGTFKLMEVNLRSMMWHRVGFINGIYLHYFLWCDAIGRKYEVPEYDIDSKKVLVYFKHEITNFMFRRSHYSKSFNVIRKYKVYFSVFDKRDLKPFLFDSINFLKLIIKRCLKLLKRD